MTEPPADGNGYSRRSVLKLTGSGFALAALGTEGTADAADGRPAAEVARGQVAEETGAAPDDLGVLHTAVASYDLLDETYYDAKVLDERDGSVHTVRVDEDGNRADRAEVRERARAAHREAYGKLAPGLHDALQDAAPDEELPISVWTDGVDRSQARRAAGVAGDTTTPAKRRAVKEEVLERVDARTDRLARKLEGVPGVEVDHAESAAPAVLATATPSGIERVERLPEVRRVFERAVGMIPTLDDSSKTHDAYDSDAGAPKYDATGYKVGVFDTNVPESDSYLAALTKRDDGAGESDHAHQVSQSAASTDDAMPGMAPNAHVYAASKYNVEDEDEDDEAAHDIAMAWFDEHDVPVVNCSWRARGSRLSRTLDEFDLRYDKYAVNRDLPVVFSAGNYDSGSNRVSDTHNVDTPARGFNTITVGGTANAGTGDDKRDDEWWGGSCYVDPESEHEGELTKPEVSAVGSNVRFPSMDEGDDPIDGTSFAAPQVSGLITLLRVWAEDETEEDLVTRPELAKAIVTASSFWDGDYSEDKLGTGTIRAPMAEQTVTQNQYHVGTIQEGQDEATFRIDDVAEGETVTVSLVWLSDPSDRAWEDNDNARAEVDLDLAVNPEGMYRIGHRSSLYDRSYEWVRFQASDADYYEVVVDNVEWEAQASERDFAVAWSRTVDTEAPQTPPNLRATSVGANSVTLDWEEAFDQGNAGGVRYRVFANGWEIDRDTNDHTDRGEQVDQLAPGQEYQFAVQARDLAWNWSNPRVETYQTDSAGELIVHNFDGDPAWPSWNMLGNSADAGNFVNGDGEVDRRALALDYDGSGWFKSEVQRDVSDYRYLKFRLAATSSYATDHFTLDLGGVSDVFSELADGYLTSSGFRILSVDMVEQGMDRSAPGDLEFNFWNGDDGDEVLHVDQIWFE